MSAFGGKADISNTASICVHGLSSMPMVAMTQRRTSRRPCATLTGDYGFPNFRLWNLRGPQLTLRPPSRAPGNQGGHDGRIDVWTTHSACNWFRRRSNTGHRRNFLMCGRVYPPSFQNSFAYISVRLPVAWLIPRGQPPVPDKACLTADDRHGVIHLVKPWRIGGLRAILAQHVWSNYSQTADIFFSCCLMSATTDCVSSPDWILFAKNLNKSAVRRNSFSQSTRLPVDPTGPASSALSRGTLSSLATGALSSIATGFASSRSHIW